MKQRNIFFFFFSSPLTVRIIMMKFPDTEFIIIRVINLKLSEKGLYSFSVWRTNEKVS